MKILEFIPRFFYEFLAYFVPGVLLALFLYIIKLDEISSIADKFLKLFSSEPIQIFIIIMFSYIVGRIIYAIGDLTTKLFIKKMCGDPDKYLPLNNFGILHKYVKDYKKKFKEKLQESISDVFLIEKTNLKDFPYFKLCCDWIDIKAPTKSIIIHHHHTIEIFSRNSATTLLLIAIICFFSKYYFYGECSLIIYIMLLYYYYVRQIKRARSVYELFYVLYIGINLNEKPAITQS